MAYLEKLGRFRCILRVFEYFLGRTWYDPSFGQICPEHADAQIYDRQRGRLGIPTDLNRTKIRITIKFCPSTNKLGLAFGGGIDFSFENRLRRSWLLWLNSVTCNRDSQRSSTKCWICFSVTHLFKRVIFRVCLSAVVEVLCYIDIHDLLDLYFVEDPPKNEALPLRWIAPESFDGVFSKKSDMWMYGAFMTNNVACFGCWIDLVNNAQQWKYTGSEIVPQNGNMVVPGIFSKQFVHVLVTIHVLTFIAKSI